MNVNFSPCVALLFFTLIALTPLHLRAEGKPAQEDWAEQAAMEYDKKAAAAVSAGRADLASIYLKMAQMKRKAGEAAKRGEDFVWDEYHALNEHLHRLLKPGGEKGKAEHGSKTRSAEDKDPHSAHEKKSAADPGKKSDSPKAEDSSGLLQAAQDWQNKALAALQAGEEEEAAIFLALSKCKLDAAAAAARGESYDWTEYDKLVARLQD